MTNTTSQNADRLPCVICYSSFVISLIWHARRELPPRPAGTPTPDPTAADAFATATASCRGFRSIEGELALSGRAGGERVRGRVLTGLESGGAVRLEASAPFGAPFFILAGRNERATLVLPRERRVLKDTGVPKCSSASTGLALGADDLRLIVSGCLVDTRRAGRRPAVAGRMAGRHDRSRARRVSAHRAGPARADRRRLRSVARRLLRSTPADSRASSACVAAVPRRRRTTSTSPRASSSSRSTRRSIRAHGSLMYHPTPIR